MSLLFYQGGGSPEGEVIATISPQVAQSLPLHDTIQALNLTALFPSEQVPVRVLLHQYDAVFSTHEGDVERTDFLFESEFLAEVPACQRFGCTPRSEHEVVKAQICQLHDSQVT